MITPIDIENKVFKKSMVGGYDIKDVEDFLERLIIDYETSFKMNEELKTRCLKLEEDIMYYRTLESGIENSIEVAKEEADNIKEEAVKEIEMIEKTQTELLTEELKDLKSSIRRKEEEFETISRQIQIYKIKIKSMFEAGLDIIKEEE